MIGIDGLRVRFGANEVVHGVSLAVPRGGSFGLVGESGAGKSPIWRAYSGRSPAPPGPAPCGWRARS